MVELHIHWIINGSVACAETELSKVCSRHENSFVPVLTSFSNFVLCGSVCKPNQNLIRPTLTALSLSGPDVLSPGVQRS